MCGVTFIFSTQWQSASINERLKAMERAQLHRGPDDQGALVQQIGDCCYGLGQQRLSILDISPAGHQPMVSACGRYALSFNGEIYNYREIAAELGRDPNLAISTSDTAVVLAALIRWGTDALRRFNGMWSILFVDRQEGTLILSRDRLGVKPLYYSQDERHSLVVSSEIKGVLAGFKDRKFKLNLEVVGRFLLQSQIAAQPETFFQGIFSFPPASYAILDLKSPTVHLQSVRFWNHPFQTGVGAAAKITPAEVRQTFIDSVKLRLRADVPVGILLSGGLDSSSILAAAREALPHGELVALSVISRDPKLNEEPFIDRMVKHVGCQVIKTQSDDDPQGIWNDLDETIWHFEYPLYSLSNVAHRQIIREARRHGLVVLLTGQGSDEQLAGYNKFFYFYMQDRIRKGRLTGPLSMLAGCLYQGTILGEFRVKNAKRYIPFVKRRFSRQWIGAALNRVTMLNNGLGRSYEEREWRDVSQFSLPALLTSEDRMSMANSCEMREPFLDYRLVELFGRIPPERKLHRGWTKHILRKAMQDLLPREIAWRRDKKGYAIPEDQWLRTTLRPQVHEALNRPLIAADLGLLNPVGARAAFDNFLNRQHAVRFQDILSIVSLEKWLKTFSPHIEGVG
jgi:asparagine synthase (glutamine-hydrolysing)